jgi:cysteine desulfurase/selenocysteine lyase
MNDAGELLLDEYEALLNDKTKLVAVAHVSNALGTVNPIKQMIDTAHKYGVPVADRWRPVGAAPRAGRSGSGL